MGEVSREQETKDVFCERPHVVIVGAGASIAAVPEDRNGRRLPDMRGLARLPEISDLFAEAEIGDAESDFEAAYSRLREVGDYPEIGDRIDAVVREFFAAVQIVEDPTIYDHLLLSLRPKDVVATFNWDPLIVQAELRLRQAGIHQLPRVVFLHGNVAIGVCLEHSEAGMVGGKCVTCREPLTPSPLLYPVTEKDYESNAFIAHAWHSLRWGLEHGRVVSVFGYSAPVSDVAAITEFKRAWGTPEERQFEQFEFVIRPGSDREAVRERWDEFVHTHHYETHEDFFDSWLANHPRRSGEAYYRQYIEANFIDVNPPPRDLDLEATIDWYRELIEFEREKESG